MSQDRRDLSLYSRLARLGAGPDAPHVVRTLVEIPSSYSGITAAPGTLASAGSARRTGRGITSSRSGEAGASTPWYVS